MKLSCGSSYALLSSVALAFSISPPLHAQTAFSPSGSPLMWDANGVPLPSTLQSSELATGTDLALQAPAVPSGVAVGRTPGSFGVSPSGAAAYHISLWTPPGIAGLRPSLALTYSSAGGDGLFGVGWSVTGFSGISRCNKTYDQDGIAATAQITNTDRFCLDGKKLRSFAGTTYGADGAQYQTEVADFSLVISHGTAGVGPAWFEVHRKNGLTYQYGNTTDSALIATGTSSIFTWALNRISDKVGNHIDFAYTNDTTNQVLRPNTITYTTSPGASQPNFQVSFAYVSRTDIPKGFFTGGQFQEPYLGQTITVSSWNGTAFAPVRSYNLTYTSGTATGRSLVHTIQECSPTQCFSPTTATYQSGATGWGAAVTSSGNWSQLANALPGDFNGDGFEDVVYPDPTSGHWYCALGTSTGAFATPFDTGIPSSVTLLSIDYNTDGKLDLIGNNSSGNWRVYFFSAAGSAFTWTDTTIPVPPVIPRFVMIGDVDGDGRDDLIYAVTTGTWQGPDTIYYRLNTGSGFGAQTLLYQWANGANCVICIKINALGSYTSYQSNSRVRRPDFNGDGRMDFLVNLRRCTPGLSGQCTPSSNYTYNWTALVSDPNSLSYDALGTVALGWNGSSTSPPLLGDFNGDGCTDIAFSASSFWQISYATCYRSGATSIFNAVVNTGLTSHNIMALAMDWDGDGRDDIVEPDLNTTSGHWGVFHSTGSGLAAWTSLGISYVPNTAAVVADVNGDGQFDLLYPSSTSAPTVLPHAGATITPDLLTSITDGFGVNFSPNYTQATRTTYYTKGSGATYPEIDVQPPLTIVASYTASDGIGGTYTVGQTYTQARINVRRRGFEGFLTHRQHDSRNNRYHTDNFGQLFPYTGMLLEAREFQPDGATLLTDVIATPAKATLDTTVNNQRVYAYVQQTVESRYEYGGTLNGQMIAQATTVYSYAGPNGYTYGNPSQIQRTSVDKDPNSPWPTQTYTDTFNITPHESGTSTVWCIDLADQESETRTDPATTPPSSGTHTRSYGIDDTYCRRTSMTDESGNNTLQVATSYGYDSCGNLYSATITGKNPDGTAMAARNTTVSFGTHCIVAEKITNALLQSATTGYRYDLVLPTSTTDENNLSISWTYNDVGQKTLETRPDGTRTATSVIACGSGNCGNTIPTPYYIEYDEQDNTATHAVFRTDYRYFDPFNRQIQTASEPAVGGYNTVDLKRFDALGRVALSASPFGNGVVEYDTTWQYDLLNRVLSETRPISATNSQTQSVVHTYQGRTSTIQDPKGNITNYRTDVIGELRQVVDPDGTSTTTYTYDPFGNPVSIQDPQGRAITRTYDLRGHLITSSDGDRGTWTFQTDSLGEVINTRDANTTAPAWTQQLSYDVLGRPLTRVEPEGTTTWTWGTDPAKHEIGHLAGLSDQNDTETYTFDSFGRPLTRSMTWSGTSYQVSYTYNNIGKLNTLMYPLAFGQANAFQVLYGYSHGELTSIQNYTGGIGGTTFWEATPGVANNIDGWGHITDETLGTTTPVRIRSAFDGVTGWLNTRQVGSNGNLANLQSLAYQWDKNGNLQQREDMNQSITEVFVLDNLDRLQSSTLNGVPNLGVTIDNTGNITQRTENGNTYAYTYDATHVHGVSKVTWGSNSLNYSYDNNGNMTTWAGNTIKYTSYNLPSVIHGPGGVVSSFGYGPDRQRKYQAASYAGQGDPGGTEQTTYVFGLYELEVTPAQNHYKYFVPVPGGTQIIYDLASVTGTQTTYISSDNLGSAALVMDTTGAAKIGESFSAYGYRRSSDWSAPLSPTSSDYTVIASTTRRGYTDGFHEVLDNLNLIHMGGRVYDPFTGRFLSPDPVLTKLGDSQRTNPYSYVENRPLTLTDPTGRDVRGQGSECWDFSCSSMNDGSPNPTARFLAYFGGFTLLSEDNYDDNDGALPNSSNPQDQGSPSEPPAGPPTDPAPDEPPQPATTAPPDPTQEEIVVTGTRDPRSQASLLPDSLVIGQSMAMPIAVPFLTTLDPCPGTGATGSATEVHPKWDPKGPKSYVQDYDIPTGSVKFYDDDGQAYFLPPYADLKGIYQAGLDLSARDSAISQIGDLWNTVFRAGTFDFQRSGPGRRFFKPYLGGANYGLGVLANAMGLDLSIVQSIAKVAAIGTGEKPADLAAAAAARAAGYKAAAAGECHK